MKRVFISLIITCLVFFTVVFTVSAFRRSDDQPYKVAMVTDFADIDDNSFNQQTYEGCREWCEEHNIPFAYYKPSANTDAEREKCVQLAIERGYNNLYLPGFTYGPIIAKFSIKYPEVTFIGIDLQPSDLPKDYVPTDNIICFSYREEIAGYLAGYAAAVEGYTKHGFLGGMHIPSVLRFGYGYAQGLNDAASELKISQKMNYNIVCANQFYGDSDVTKYIDNWYKSGTEVVFSCGGSIYSSVALAAKDNNKKVIGVDVDQSIFIDRDYGKGLCITSAMKGVAATCKMSLQKMSEGYVSPECYIKLGLVSSTDLDSNFVGLPIKTWSMKKFTIERYREIVQEIIDEKRIINNDTSKLPTLEHVDIHDLGSIK